MPPTSLLLAMIVGLTLVLVGRRASASLPAAPAWLTGPLFPLLVGVGTAGLTAWIWGGFRPEAAWHDEAAYRLQAELLAHFRLARAGVAVADRCRVRVGESSMLILEVKKGIQ